MKTDKKRLLKINPNTYKEVAAHIKSIRSESSEKDRNLISELTWLKRTCCTIFAQADQAADFKIQAGSRI